MSPWELFKQGFFKWEDATARLSETLLRSPLVVAPLAGALSSSVKFTRWRRETKTALWTRLGLPTRHDQVRTLHQLNEVLSRLNDLEEALAAQQQAQPSAAPAENAE